MVQSNVVKTLPRRRKKYGEDAKTFCITSGVLGGLIGEMTKSIISTVFLLTIFRNKTDGHVSILFIALPAHKDKTCTMHIFKHVGAD